MWTFGGYLSAALVLLTLCAIPESAVGAAVIWVGDSNPESCTEATLRDAVAYAALNGGRTIKFNCGGAPVTIGLTSTLPVPSDTTINGDDLITLSGPVVGYLLAVGHSSTAELKNLTITNLAGFGGTSQPQGFGVLNEGALTIVKSRFSGHDGGAISNTGTLAVRDSAFSHNGFSHDSVCLAIESNGVLTVANTTFEGNRGDVGALCNYGTATIRNSTFSGNFSDQVGGAIYTTGTLRVSNSTFSDNSATYSGGAIFVSGGALTVSNSTFSSNHVVVGGGAIAGSGTIKNSLFSGNRSGQIGGALNGQFVVDDSVFSDNTAGFGGGALFGAGTITNSSFTNNSADQGGAIRYGPSDGPLIIRKSSITGNFASEVGGGIHICCGSPDPILKNTVVTGNTPDNIAHE